MKPARAAKHRRRTPRGPVLPALALNMTAMIDVVFMLLIFFILTVDFRVPEDALSLDATKQNAASTSGGPALQSDFTLPERPVVVSVRSVGSGPDEYRLSCDEPALKSPAGAADLEARAAQARGATLPATQGFVILPDPDTLWEHTLLAFSAIQRAGYTEISLARATE